MNKPNKTLSDAAPYLLIAAKIALKKLKTGEEAEILKQAIKKAQS